MSRAATFCLFGGGLVLLGTLLLGCSEDSSSSDADSGTGITCDMVAASECGTTYTTAIAGTTDPSTMCSLINNFSTCITDLSGCCELDLYKNSLAEQAQQIAQICPGVKTCESSGSSTGSSTSSGGVQCDTTSAIACTTAFSNSAQNAANPGYDVCAELTTYVDCIIDLPGCCGMDTYKNGVATATQTLAAACPGSQTCPGSSPSSSPSGGSSGAATCDITSYTACTTAYATDMNSGDLCGAYSTYASCVMNLPGCCASYGSVLAAASQAVAQSCSGLETCPSR